MQKEKAEDKLCGENAIGLSYFLSVELRDVGRLSETIIGREIH